LAQACRFCFNAIKKCGVQPAFKEYSTVFLQQVQAFLHFTRLLIDWFLAIVPAAQQQSPLQSEAGAG
jgi:DNA topoisomerase IA